MKKLFLTAAIILGYAMGSFAQNQEYNGGLFRRGYCYEWMIYDEWLSRDGGTFSLCLPGHNFTTNWNGGSQGHDNDLIVPLGNGALLLIGFGAAYAMTKRNKKD